MTAGIVAFWQGSKEEAQAITVDVGLTSPPQFSPQADVISTRQYGIVEYGSDGNKTSVKFDLVLP